VSISYKNGNVLTTTQPVIAHGVNCRGAFGAGVAGAIAAKYPRVRQEYLKWFKQGKWELGEIQVVQLPERTFVNMATQDTYAGPGVHINYDALSLCLNQVFSWCDATESGLAMPRVGAGLARGDWDKIKRIIEYNYRWCDFPLEVWELKANADL
jgi:O-acetyl-ADP-ribose deacetylase (regulator of RNase III)